MGTARRVPTERVRYNPKLHVILRLTQGGVHHRVPMEKVLHNPKLMNNRVTPERAPYNPTLYSYAIIPLRIMPLGSLRRRLRIIGSFPIMSFSHGEECHRVPTEQVPYNPKLMNNRVTMEDAPCNALIP